MEQVVVTPNGTWTSNKTIHTTGYTQTFRVTNETGDPQYVVFSCSGASGIVCTGLNKADATIPGNSFTNQILVGLQVRERAHTRCAASRRPMPRALCPTSRLTRPAVPRWPTTATGYHPSPSWRWTCIPTPPLGAGPASTSLQVKVGGSFVTFLNGETLLRFSGTSGSTRYRLAGQFNASSGYVHGTVYPLEIIVAAKIGSTLYTNRWVTRYLHVNTADLTSGLFNGIAKGWTLAGLQRLHGQSDGSKLILEGNGNAVFFKYDSATGTLQAPNGDGAVPIGGSVGPPGRHQPKCLCRR